MHTIVTSHPSPSLASASGGHGALDPERPDRQPSDGAHRARRGRTPPHRRRAARDRFERRERGLSSERGLSGERGLSSERGLSGER
eukprot:3372734-Prymnesium_polylepis.3